MSRMRIHDKDISPRKKIQVMVPSYFKCPISLDLMRDPVIVATGMTYDRSSIQKWFADGNYTCPTTMQILHNQDLIPNHTLRRLIQDWCVTNKSMGVERIPTPRQPLDRQHVEQLLKDATRNDLLRIDALRTLREKAKESACNLKCIAEAGGVVELSSVLSEVISSESMEARDMEACEEAVATLSLLPLDEGVAQRMAAAPGLKLQLSCFSRVLNKGSLDARINTAILLENLTSISHDLNRSVGTITGIIEGLVDLLREDLNQVAVKAALRALSTIATSRRHCRQMVQTGAVGILVEMLPPADKSTAEKVLVILASLCKGAEGRAAVAEHALAIPAITKKMCRVTDTATEAAITILWALCSFSADEESIHERAVEAGLFAKLLLLMQMEFSPAAKHRIADILRLLKKPCTSHEHNLEHARSHVIA